MAQSEHTAKRAKPQQSAPVSSHPMFPAMVALWFAALFGIGSMVLPLALFDSFATQLGMGAAGPTIRLGVALLATAMGAALGLTMARKLAAAQAGEPARRREFSAPAPLSPLDKVSAPRKPLSVHDALEQSDPSQTDEEGGSRRRALAMEEPEGPSEWFQPSVPYSDSAYPDMPGTGSEAAEEMCENEAAMPAQRQEFGQPVSDVPETMDAEMPHLDALDLGDFATQDGNETEIFGSAGASAFDALPMREHPAGLAMPSWASEEASADLSDTAFHEEEGDLEEAGQEESEQGRDFAEMSFSGFAAHQPGTQDFTVCQDGEKADAFPHEVVEPACPAVEGDLGGLGLGELSQRLEQAIRLRAERDAARQAELEAIRQDQAAHAEQAEQDDQGEDTNESELADRLAGLTDSPIAEDGGLTSFFGAAAGLPSFLPPASGPADQGEPASHDDSEEDTASASGPDHFAPPSIPRALQPVELAEIDDTDGSPLLRDLGNSKKGSGTQARQMFGAPMGFAAPEDAVNNEVASEDACEDGDENWETSAEENFGSLSDMANPFRAPAEYVRIEEPEEDDDSIEPAVIFPAHAARRSASHTEAQADTPSASDGQTGFKRKSGPAPAASEATPLSEMPAAPFQTPPASADPAETERALRMALATLQKMSGAA